MVRPGQERALRTLIKGVSITLNYDTTAQAKKSFEALAAGGQITMPMQPDGELLPI